MGGKDGKQNAVAGPAPGDAAAFATKEVGKETLVGNEWVWHGAKCDGKDAVTPGCFLDDSVRLRYLIDFKKNVGTAATNYKIALGDLRIDELMKKEDDLNWVLSFALEIAGGHLVEMAVKGLSILRASAASRLSGAALKSGDTSGWSAKTAQALASVSKKQFETLAKLPINGVKGQVSSQMRRRQNGAASSQKDVVVKYIEQLRNHCDTAFNAFEALASATATDVELVVLFEAMKPENHQIEVYKELLGAKVERFRTSGIPAIGRKAGRDRTTGAAAVYRDTRVVWVRDFLGNRRLYFQSQEGNADHAVRRPGDPGFEQVFPHQTFGPHDPREAPQLGEPVPDEFKDVAIERSQQQWGLINEIEDPATRDMRWRGIDVTSFSPKVARKSGTAGASPAPAGSAGAPTPTRNRADVVPGADATSALSLQLKSTPANVSKLGSDPDADLDAAGM